MAMQLLQSLQAPPLQKEKIAVLQRENENPRPSTRAMARTLRATLLVVAKPLIPRAELRPRPAFAAANLVIGLHNARNQLVPPHLPTRDRLLRLQLKEWQCTPRRP